MIIHQDEEFRQKSSDLRILPFFTASTKLPENERIAVVMKTNKSSTAAVATAAMIALLILLGDTLSVGNVGGTTMTSRLTPRSRRWRFSF